MKSNLQFKSRFVVFNFRCLAVVTVLFALELFSNVAVAQLPSPISPWLSLNNRRTSPLDNYNAVVKPQQDAMRNYANQQSQMKQQEQQLQGVERTITGGSGIDLGGRANSPLDPNRQLLNAPGVIPSTQSVPASYGNYLHYYQKQPDARVPNFSPNGTNRRR